jgi:hypothetical protein
MRRNPGGTIVQIRETLVLLAFAAACGDKVDLDRAASDAAPTGEVAKVSARQLQGYSRADGAPNAPAPSPATPTQKLIRSAQLRIEVMDVERAVRLVDTAARAREAITAGARLVQASDGQNPAELTLRVPAHRFDDLLADLRRLGVVRDEAVTTDDVTKAYNDLETRLGVKEQMVVRLKALLATHTAKLSDVLEVERELARTVAELEQMKGERRFYDQQVAMASISVTLFQPATIVRPRVGAQAKLAFNRSIEVLQDSAGLMVSFVAFLLPWVVLAAMIMWLLARFGVRWPIRSERHILQP